MKKALLALLAFPVWYRGDGSICNYSLGALQRKPGDSWVWLVGGEVPPWRRSHFPRALENREELGAEISPEKR